MYLGRVIGRLVATQCSPGLEEVPFQLVQPLDETGRASGAPLVACTAVPSGPGDLVHYVDGREAALACPETFVPVDATILGCVEEAEALGRSVAPTHAEIQPVPPAAPEPERGPERRRSAPRRASKLASGSRARGASPPPDPPRRKA